MEAVELVGGHHVQVLLGFLDGPKVTAGVQVHATVVEAGLVQDAHVREDPIGLRLLAAINGGGEHLLEGLAGVDEAIEGRCFHDGTIGIDVDGVLLGGEVRVHLEDEALVSGLGLGAGGGLEGGDESAYRFLGKLVQVLVHLHGGTLHAEGALGDGDIGRHGNHMEGLRLRLGTGQNQHRGKN